MALALPELVQAILFAAGEPVRIQRLVASTGASAEEVRAALETLRTGLVGGVRLVLDEEQASLVTAPEAHEVLKKHFKLGAGEELTRAALETLAVIAYVGPCGRAVIEQVRGVNCALILRNLAMRGLIEDDGAEEPLYRLTHGALAMLGVTDAAQLPDFAALHAHPALQNGTV